MNLVDKTEAVELAPGAWFHLRRPTVTGRLAVESAASEAYGRLSAGAAVLEDYGFAADEFGILADKHVFAGLLVFMKACAWGEYLIAGWSFGGVALEDHPPVDQASIRQVLNAGIGDHPPLYEALLLWAERPFRARRAEGNV